jgi:uncharacterized membrane protein YgcG
MKNKILLIASIIVLSACYNKKKHKKLKFTEYKIAREWIAGGGKINDDNNMEMDYTYLYIINSNDKGYYYYSSNSKITDFSKISWVKTKEDPLKEEEEETIEETNEMSIDFDVSGITPSEEEDVSNEESETSEGESDSSNDGGNDSGSSDSGSGDSGGGGGDSGGGDGGGGGE